MGTVPLSTAPIQPFPTLPNALSCLLLSLAPNHSRSGAPSYNAVFGKIGRHDFLRIKYHSNPRRRAGGFLFPVFGRSRELSTGKAKENSKGKDRNARQPQVVYRRRIVVCETKEREEERSPYNPLKEKREGKETSPGASLNPLKPARAYASTCTRVRTSANDAICRPLR